MGNKIARTDSISPISQPLEKIANRQHHRSLTTFLKFDFSSFSKKQGERLALASEYKEGKTFTVLKQINLYELGWIERIALNFNGRLDPKKIAQFVESELKYWHPETDQQSINLEKQFALFTRKWKKTHDISVKNPFKKTLKVIVRYPFSTQMKEKSTDIKYDRLTAKKKLTAKVDKFLSEEVTIMVPSRTKIHSDPAAIAIHAAPADVFQTVIRDPLKIMDPATEMPHHGDRILTFTFQNPDKDVVNHLLWKEGRKEGDSILQKELTILIPDKEKKKLMKVLGEDAAKKAEEAAKKQLAGYTKIVYSKPNPPKPNSVTALGVATAVGNQFLDTGKAAGDLALNGLNRGLESVVPRIF